MGEPEEDEGGAGRDPQLHQAKRRELAQRLRAGELENEVIEIEVEDTTPHTLQLFTGMGVEEMGVNLQDMFGGLLPKRKRGGAG